MIVKGLKGLKARREMRTFRCLKNGAEGLFGKNKVY
jgi:hypothetical protein